MGKGKGEVEYWAAVVKPGTILFEIGGVSEEVGPRDPRPRRPQAAGHLPVRHPPAHDLSRPTATGRRPTGPPAGDAIAMSKPAELRDQTDEQLELLLKDVQQNLFRLRLQSETERLEAPSEIIKAKREIARIKTILRLREIERANAVAAAGPLSTSRVADPRPDRSSTESSTSRKTAP